MRMSLKFDSESDERCVASLAMSLGCNVTDQGAEPNSQETRILAEKTPCLLTIERNSVSGTLDIPSRPRNALF